MLTVEQIYDIREMYFKEGKSMREISRLSGYDRETLKRYVECFWQTRNHHWECGRTNALHKL